LSDIFQEVEEDVRREHYEKLWKKYGNYVIAAAAVLVLGVAGYQAWRNYDLSQRQSASDQYEAAVQLALKGDLPKAETSFQTIAQGAAGGYDTLAKFQLASAQLAQGKRDPAVALLKELTENSDPVIANAARLKLAWTMADASPKPEINTILQPLTAMDSPWRFAAAEVLAYIDLRDGQAATAQAEYAKLAAETAASASLRQRAGALSEYLKANPSAGAAPGTSAVQGTNP
jgi:hypothetical protein